jgi:SAM-dependent methyltransferase
MGSVETAGQSGSVAEANSRFFLDNIEMYRKSVDKIGTYKNIRNALNPHVIGIEHLLDIGNGGIFDYDASPVRKITALDLFFDRLPDSVRRDYFPPNAEPVPGSALDIPFPDNSFDGVLMVMLIHHLVGKTWQASWANAIRAFDEAKRVLSPGGKFILVESCIPRWFFPFEKLAFAPTAGLVERVTSHPPAFQYPADDIHKALADRFDISDMTLVPVSSHVLHFGMKVPSMFSPVKPYVFVGRKRD